jgi:hypothetical protein
MNVLRFGSLYQVSHRRVDDHSAIRPFFRFNEYSTLYPFIAERNKVAVSELHGLFIAHEYQGRTYCWTLVVPYGVL